MEYHYNDWDYEEWDALIQRIQTLEDFCSGPLPEAEKRELTLLYCVQNLLTQIQSLRDNDIYDLREEIKRLQSDVEMARLGA